jgi:hypothetical protein
MPSIRVSGILDEGINSRDSERLLSSSSSNQRKQVLQSRQRRVDTTNRPPVTKRTHQQRQPGRTSYERVPSNSRHQTQTQRYSVHHDTDTSAQPHEPAALNNKNVLTHPNHRHPQHDTNTMHPMQYQPLVTTKSHHEQSIASSNLDDSDNLREFIIEKTASYSSSSSKNEDYNPLGYHHQSPLPQYPTRHSTIMDGPSQRFKSTEVLPTFSKTYIENTSSSSIIPIEFEQEHDEFEYDEEDYCCNCCNLHSTSSGSSQPLCNEGTKNLCTLAIWAIIILVIVNRFLVHMSMFLHRHGAAGGGVEVQSVP